MFTGSVSFLVIGSDFKTDRAAGRLAEIGISVAGDALTLRRERGKIGRRPAVGVYTCRGRQIGYIQPHEVDLILSDIDNARAAFQSREPFGAVVRITLDGSRPALRQPKPSPKLRPPPAEPRDEYCDIFPLRNQSTISRPTPSPTDVRSISTNPATLRGSVREQNV
ncbi:hypothetical protein [Sphingobium sp. WCS2017Hpa-17]|uniref:hypothetical protein n=1 Tax=Sphingobium sp. WCS2017Hpa-17 TaxID=3073638 RepID=UPI00288A852A|nr:hypothetical protein [Sphingobium sp. WCS2017Hpa-17]